MSAGSRLLEAAAWIFVGGAVLAVVFVGTFYVGMRMEMRSTEVAVPDLVGLALDEARERAAPHALALEVVDERNDPSVPSGAILEQMPAAGVVVRQGRKVKLVMSLGDRVLRVPGVVGEGARAVTMELRQDGFLAGDEARAPSWIVPSGRIAAQVPPPDAPAVPGTRIHRLVSLGPTPAVWVMPELIGLDRASAEGWIEASGFRMGSVRRVPSGRRAAGTVVGQLPLPGYPVRSKDVIELTVAD
jgi:serine/threonine-protein kinase